MNKILCFFFVAIFLFNFSSRAQSPQGIPYQAIVRNASGNIISNQAVKFRFSVHDSVATGTIVYKELHTLTTNLEGLVNVNIGQGTVQAGVFSSINWGKNGKFIQTELDALNNNTYTDLGTTQMMSVPYALYAQSSPGGLPSSGVLGDMLYWNGTQWAPMSIGSYGQNLVNCNGVPTWGGCTPVISTNTISNIFTTTATSGGNISNNGGNNILSSGICWATTQNPTISNSVYYNGNANGNAIGNYTSYLTSLLPNTIYYVRSFASNSAGISYGNQISFTTIALRAPSVITGGITNKTANTATVSGNLTDSGTAYITSRGICFATSINPTIANSIMASTSNAVGNFTVDISGLLPSNIYHYRAYATNAVNTSYGVDSVFTTAAVSVPTITTTTVTSITGTTCASGGNVTYNGGATITARGVCWSTAINPTVALTTKTTDGSGTGTFISNINTLLSNTTYYLRAYATNSVGTSYGNSISFVTLKIPVVLTGPITNVSYSSAKVNLNVTDSGNRAILSRGVCYSTTANPTIANSFLAATMNGNGIYVANLTGLNNSSTYHVRAYATTDAGTGYGADSVFTTLTGALPVLTASQSTACDGGYGGIILSGQVSDSGGLRILSKGFVFGTSPSPTLSKNVVIDPNTLSNNIYIQLKGLSNNTFYARSFATNSLGTIYGSEVSFLINYIPNVPPDPACDPLAVCCPNLIAMYSNVATNISYNTATVNVFLNYSFNFYSTDGICYGVNPLPTISDTVRIVNTSTSNYLFSLAYLLPNTTYYYRPFSNTAFGIVYGEVMSFTTLAVQSVMIGTQNLMNKNLSVVTYKNGDIIPQVADAQWLNITTGAWCWYRNDSATYAAPYGRLYNWYAVNDARGLAPQGWHVMSDSELTILATFLGGSSVAGAAMKESGTNHWVGPNTGATNSSGFLGLPGGWRYFSGVYTDIGTFGYWWSSTESSSSLARSFSLSYSGSGCGRTDSNKIGGLSVRCIKD